MLKTGPKRKPWASRYNIDPATGCYEWNGGRNRAGYGLYPIDNGQRFAHRVAWANLHGEIPPGMIICHHCDNPCCVNPDHLFLGTPADNTADMMKKGRDRHRPQVGEKHWKARLTPADVMEMRRLYGAGGVRQVDLASRFGVAQAYVSEIVRGEAWAHLPQPSSGD